MAETGASKLKGAMIWYANRMAQITAYDTWNDAFCRKEAREYADKVKDHLKDIDITTVSVDDLLAVGFGWWDETHTLLLCPLWLAHVLFPDKDHDHRLGNIAYGYHVENGKVLPREGCISD